MKHLNKILGIIALITVIGFSMTACGDDNGDVITVQNTSGAITITGLPPYANDYYVSGIGGDSYFAASNVNTNGIMTRGKITNQSVTLKVWEVELLSDNSAAFRNFNGNDTVMFYFHFYETNSLNDFTSDDGEAQYTFMASGSVTFVSGEANVNFNDLTISGYNGDVITVGSTNGKVTITDIPADANGSRVFAMHHGDSLSLFATANISSSGTVTFGQISGGSVELKIWEIVVIDVDTPPEFIDFDGSGTFDFTCFVFTSRSSASLLEEFDPSGAADTEGTGTVTLTNGIGTIPFSSITMTP